MDRQDDEPAERQCGKAVRVGLAERQDRQAVTIAVGGRTAMRAGGPAGTRACVVRGVLICDQRSTTTTTEQRHCDEIARLYSTKKIVVFLSSLRRSDAVNYTSACVIETLHGRKITHHSAVFFPSM